MFSNVLGPSDALAAHLCSEIAQGRVKCDPPLVVFQWVLACGGTIKGGGTMTVLLIADIYNL